MADTIASAGYFEGLTITAEDRERSRQYLANSERTRLLEQVTDVESYLRSLAMNLTLESFNDLGLARTTQLINKTNQFNVTTQRYVESEVRALMSSPEAITLTARLADKFGDNGLIAILIARLEQGSAARIDTWLMSCRVSGPSCGRGMPECAGVGLPEPRYRSASLGYSSRRKRTAWSAICTRVSAFRHSRPMTALESSSSFFRLVLINRSRCR